MPLHLDISLSKIQLRFSSITILVHLTLVVSMVNLPEWHMKLVDGMANSFSTKQTWFYPLEINVVHCSSNCSPIWIKYLKWSLAKGLGIDWRKFKIVYKFANYTSTIVNLHETTRTSKATNGCIEVTHDQLLFLSHSTNKLHSQTVEHMTCIVVNFQYIIKE